jgi:hypothetical protein
VKVRVSLKFWPSYTEFQYSENNEAGIKRKTSERSTTTRPLKGTPAKTHGKKYALTEAGQQLKSNSKACFTTPCPADRKTVPTQMEKLRVVRTYAASTSF